MNVKKLKMITKGENNGQQKQKRIWVGSFLSGSADGNSALFHGYPMNLKAFI